MIFFDETKFVLCLFKTHCGPNIYAEIKLI